MACNLDDEGKSVWRMLPPGTHGRIVPKLKDSKLVKDALAKLQAHPGDAHARAALIDVLTRTTGNCIGQAIVHQPLAPEDATYSVYRSLKPGTQKAIAEGIAANGSDDQLGLKPGDPKGPVDKISRITGRCVGQAILDQAGGLLGIAKILVG